MRVWMLFVLCGLIIVGLLADSTVGAPTGVQPPRVFFLPQDKTTQIISLYESASKEIDVAAYVITSEDIASALAKARGRHVGVRVLMDQSQLRNKFSLHWTLMKEQVDTRVMSGMFNDFGIIDGQVVYVGSGVVHTDVSQKTSSYLIIANFETARLYGQQFSSLFQKASKP